MALWLGFPSAAALALPAAPARSFFVLPTGNGYGFQLFDERTSRLVAFLDHPYRYLRPGADPRKDGVERRNLLTELSLGLDGASAGADPRAPDSAEYAEQTNIIRSITGRNGRKSERFFFSPFGLEQNALVATFHAPGAAKGAVGAARLRFHLGANPVSPSFWRSTLKVLGLVGEEIRAVPGPAWVQRGRGVGALIYVPLQPGTVATCEASQRPVLADGPPCAADEGGLRFTAPLGAGGDFGVLVAYAEEPGELAPAIERLLGWIRGRPPGQILADSLRHWKAWRKPPPFAAKGEAETRLWRQSEAVLRMGQVRDLGTAGERRGSHGMMLASLSPGAWATGWVRDGAYATVALARSGHWVEAKASLSFFLNAGPVGKYKSFVGDFPYRVSLTRYFGSGEEEADYSNQKTPNIETDGWGLVLWAARQYVQQSGDTAWLSQPTRSGTVYEALRDGVARAIESQLEERPRIMKPDSSIWEVHQENARHFAYTTITAARGLCDFAALARRAGNGADHEKFSALAARVRRDFAVAFSAPEGYLLGARERSPAYDTDSSVLEAFNLGVVPPGAPAGLPTLKHLESLRTPAGGFGRLVGTESYDVDEWAYVDFRTASADFRMGRHAEGLGLVERLAERAAANGGLFPEMYNASRAKGALGAYRGSIPMVGYGSGAYMLALLDREGLFERDACE